MVHAHSQALERQRQGQPGLHKAPSQKKKKIPKKLINYFKWKVAQMRQENFKWGDEYYHKYPETIREINLFKTVLTKYLCGQEADRPVTKRVLKCKKNNPVGSRLVTFHTWQEEFLKNIFFWFTFSEKFSPPWQGRHGSAAGPHW